MEQKKETETQNTTYKILLLPWSQGLVLYIEIIEYIQLRYHDKSI